MTTPATGAISLNDIKTESVSATGASPAMSWVKDNTRKTINTVDGTVTDLNTTHNKAYYKNTTAGACNNANCTTGGAPKACDRNCADCFTSALANCVNCDTQSFLQPNCNCACTYNCNSNQYKTACACACWICACW